jgi:hypothetical protein
MTSHAKEMAVFSDESARLALFDVVDYALLAALISSKTGYRAKQGGTPA